MSLSSDICAVCKRSGKSLFSCITCQQFYHVSCLQKHVLKLSPNNCCTRSLQSSLINTRSRSGSVKSSNSYPVAPSSSKTKIALLTGITSKSSDFKKLAGHSTSRRSSMLSSPVTQVSPLVPWSPNSDSVFEQQDSSTMPPVTETLHIREATLDDKPPETTVTLPGHWETKSLDEKLTSFMEVFLKSTGSMTSKIDNLSTRLDMLQENVAINTASIKELNEDFTALKYTTQEYTKSVNAELAKLKNAVSSGSHATSPSASELVISGILEVIATKVSPDKVTVCVFDSLKVSNLKETNKKLPISIRIFLN